MSEKRIIEHARDAVPKGKTDWARLRAMSEEEIEENAAADEDNPPLTDEALGRGEVVFPQDRNKIPVYIRLDADVLAHFKAQGPGYQTRINAALAAHVLKERAAQYRKGVARKPLSAWEAARPSRSLVVRERAGYGSASPGSPRAG